MYVGLSQKQANSLADGFNGFLKDTLQLSPDSINTVNNTIVPGLIGAGIGGLGGALFAPEGKGWQYGLTGALMGGGLGAAGGSYLANRVNPAQAPAAPTPAPTQASAPAQAPTPSPASQPGVGASAGRGLPTVPKVGPMRPPMAPINNSPGPYRPQQPQINLGPHTTRFMNGMPQQNSNVPMFNRPMGAQTTGAFNGSLRQEPNSMLDVRVQQLQDHAKRDRLASLGNEIDV